MSHPGIGAMLHILSGGSEEDPAKYYGRTITRAELVKTDSFPAKSWRDTPDELDALNIWFADGTHIRLFDDGQSCCESRYITTDDDPHTLAGKRLARIEAKPGPEVEEEYETHEQVFVEVLTEDGTCVTLCTHNEHNGYYGGFGLSIKEWAWDNTQA